MVYLPLWKILVSWDYYAQCTVWNTKNVNHQPALTLTNILPFLMSQTTNFPDYCCCVHIFIRNPLWGAPTLQYLGRKKTSSSWSSSSSSPSSSSSSSTKLHLSSVYHYQVLMLKPVFSNQQVIVNSPALLRCSRAAEVYPVLVDRKGLWGGGAKHQALDQEKQKGKILRTFWIFIAIIDFKICAKKQKHIY